MGSGARPHYPSPLGECTVGDSIFLHSIFRLQGWATVPWLTGLSQGL